MIIKINKKNHIKIALISLIIACSVYFFFRDMSSLLINNYLDFSDIQRTPIPTNNFIKHHLADGLFVFSFTILLSVLWEYKLSFWVYTPLFFCCLFEILQLKYLGGTFDVIDLLVYIVGFLLAIYITKSI